VTAELLAQAAAAADTKDWARAADLLATAPPTNEVLDRRGWYCSRAKRYDDAIAAFEQLRARRPRDYLPPYMIGYQHYQQQQWAQAIPFFDEALSRRPDHIKSLWRRAYALHRLGREREAVLTAGRLLRTWTALPDDKRDEDRRRYAQACHLIGRYQASHDPAGAVELLQKAVEHEPSDPYHHYQLAKALRRTGRAGEAVAAAEAARRLNPGDANVEVEYVAALNAADRRDDAARCLRRIHRRCFGWAAYRAGTLSLQAGEVGLAVELLRRAAHDRSTRSEPRVQQALSEALAAADTLNRERGPTDVSTKATQMAARAIDPGASATASNGTGPQRQRRRRPIDATNRPADTHPSRPARATESATTGVVQLIRMDRNFGFLTDDVGTRRHFRLPAGHSLKKGDHVVFTPVDEVKGPAAQHVRPA
jgi:tetratricopeptide (TPR) repeat protein/cold shock CspA family protein